MYKVVLVDDERLILEGISAIVNWESARTVLVGTARNGIEAMEVIEREKPDIVITDIRMPGMDGLQLVERIRESEEEAPEFIVLSGFNDFNYARTAMRHGVKHYLLKPCNEGVIEQSLQEVVGELEKRRGREHFLTNMEKELSKVIPHAKSQFLKELVTNKTYGKRDWDDYARLFHLTLEHQQVRLLLFQVEGHYEYEHLFALLNIAEDVLGPERTLLGTTMGKHVLLLLPDCEEIDRLYLSIEEIKKIFTGFYKLDATAALSDPDEITGARRMYRDTLACLEYRFYLGEGSLITKKDIVLAGSDPTDSFDYDEDRLCLFVKSGRWNDAEQELNQLFDSLAGQRLDTVVTKSYLIPVYVAVIRQGDSGRMNSYLQSLSKMDSMETLAAVREFIFATAQEICLYNYEHYRSKHSDMIERMLEVIETNLSNPQLSLHWVASEILYMNADYLGKLFKKEVGDKFSSYVMKQRMEKAIALIGQMEDVRVFELAERLGFGDNPQYFSQVFKKYTGCSPSEFKRPTA
ncbi:two-component system response regulator YesN [Paenibacillus phyllosphaerae]|uniref:Two-component system response regulator YesN n=1 Tax=Paenibacillus phyllosphaerae TaxID=274593 RepID=A0A7W5AX37_9BACL|nr:response regulator [Paenibacillus phyllosphaerae]MBB3110415.1 two-component system response regulator YesN [Paenibacillus phyllosphaerae]